MPANTGKGNVETNKLRQNLEDQLDRLVNQLGDLESAHADGDLDDDEYEESKEDTVEQLKEFQESLKTAADGDMSLVDSVGAMNLAISAALSKGFKNTEVIRAMGRRDPSHLRTRLTELQRDGKVDAEEKRTQEVELLTAIQAMGGKVTAEEVDYMKEHGSAALEDFEKVSSSLAGVAALNLASSEVAAAKK